MQTNWIAVVGKGAVIALCAAIAAWGYVALLTMAQAAVGAKHGYSSEAAGMTFLFALLGSFAIGLPVALLTFFLSGPHLVRSPATLTIIALLSGVMLMLASFVLGNEEGVVMLGIPGFVAAITFGVLGWFWVLKPMRPAAGLESQHG